MIDLTQMGQAARTASRHLAILTTKQKNAALLAIADELEAQAGAHPGRRTRSTSPTAAPGG